MCSIWYNAFIILCRLEFSDDKSIRKGKSMGLVGFKTIDNFFKILKERTLSILL